jgi:repressor LexA
MVRTRKGLTERHQKIIAYLNERMSTGYPPSIREIGEAVGITSTSVVTYYLKQLTEMVKIPILGPIAAGEPMLVPAPGASYLGIGNEMDAVDVARSLLPSGEKGSELFALKVKGESMIDAMINDGDIIIMKPVIKANNGEMVAIWLPNRDETTLKYFFKEKDRYRLQPANPTMKPIMIDKAEPLEIKGKVVMVIRNVGNVAV